jgi:hypothetical protein
MSIFESQVDPDSMMTIMMSAIKQINPDDLAFLFASGKSELELRNQIGLHLHRMTNSEQIVTREWLRHDLAILEHGVPKLLVEGKSWIHADAVNPSKMHSGKKSIDYGLKQDIKKMLMTEKKFGKIDKFITIVLFTVDVQRSSKARSKEAAITYADSHRRGIKAHENAIELAGRGRGALSDHLSGYGVVKRDSLNTGYYHEFRVEADFFLLKPEATYISDLT